MASSGGTSSGSGEDLRRVMDQRKQKRMILNRESARRSRMRKKKQVDDMVAQMGQLREDNCRTATAVNVTSQMYMETTAHNYVLRAQMSELSHRLESLNEIIDCVSVTTINGYDQIGGVEYGDELMMIPWGSPYMNQPITDTFTY